MIEINKSAEKRELVPVYYFICRFTLSEKKTSFVELIYVTSNIKGVTSWKSKDFSVGSFGSSVLALLPLSHTLGRR